MTFLFICPLCFRDFQQMDICDIISVMNGGGDDTKLLQCIWFIGDLARNRSFT